mgnify:CR=1 FL=1
MSTEIWISDSKRTDHVASNVNPDDVAAAGIDAGANARSKMQIVRVHGEADFDMAVYIWSNLTHSLGVMPFESSSHLCFDAAFILRACF